MTSSARALHVIAVVLGALAAASVAFAEATPDSAWTARVEAAVGARWNVPAESLRLLWGRMPEHGLPTGDAPMRLVGGVDGWFVLSATTGDGTLAVARVRAGQDDTVCVAARDLARGQRIGADDLRFAPRVRWGGPRPGGGNIRPEPGWELRRAVAAGTVVDVPTAVPPALVNAGDRIEIGWTRGDVALQLSGVALHGARLGEPVRVRVDGRARPLTAIVDAPGHARIGTREAS